MTRKRPLIAAMVAVRWSYALTAALRASERCGKNDTKRVIL